MKLHPDNLGEEEVLQAIGDLTAYIKRLADDLEWTNSKPSWENKKLYRNHIQPTRNHIPLPEPPRPELEALVMERYLAEDSFEFFEKKLNLAFQIRVKGFNDQYAKMDVQKVQEDISNILNDLDPHHWGFNSLDRSLWERERLGNWRWNDLNYKLGCAIDAWSQKTGGKQLGKLQLKLDQYLDATLPNLSQGGDLHSHLQKARDGLRVVG
ncbi:hypothetical protein H0H93_006105 [Arthromyces matolae]|nr:hypothetical protein H0H93_006105 [Arthromyces matolae]